MTESLIFGITSNAMLMKEVTLKYVTVLEFAQLFSHDSIFTKNLASGDFFFT